MVRAQRDRRGVGSGGFWDFHEKIMSFQTDGVNSVIKNSFVCLVIRIVAVLANNLASPSSMTCLGT